MSLKESIALNEIYYATSKKTGKPHVDQEFKVHVFIQLKDIKTYMEEDPELIDMEGPKYMGYDTLCELCYMAGADIICFHEKSQTEDIAIKKPYNKYYNQLTNRAVAGLKDFKRKFYLYMLSECKFIIPCTIKNGIEIYYGGARNGEESYCMAFTDLDEYALWEQGEKYSPLEVTYAQLKKIAHGSDVILNIAGNRYVLTQEKITKIDTEMKRRKKEAEEKKSE